MAICGVCDGLGTREQCAVLRKLRHLRASVDIKFAPPALTRGDPELLRIGASARLGSPEPVDFSGLSLIMRRADNDAVVETVPLSYYRTGPSAADRKDGEPIPLEALLDLAQSGVSTTVSASIAGDGYALLGPSPSRLAYLNVNAASPAVMLVDEQVVWRPELAAIEIAVRLKKGSAALVERAELSLQAAPSARSIESANDEILFKLDSVGRAVGARIVLLLSFGVTSADVRESS